MAVPTDRKYSKEHEWAMVAEGGEVVVGISDYAQEELGDIVYVELPQAGTEVSFLKPFGVVESVKAASDLFAPVSGQVTAVNQELADRPELVNQDPYGDGWMIRVNASNKAELDQLLGPEAYQEMIQED